MALMDLLFARQAEMELIGKTQQIRYRIIRIERMLTYWLAQPPDNRTDQLVFGGDGKRTSLEGIRAELRAKLAEARAELVAGAAFNCGGLGCGSQPCSCAFDGAGRAL